MVSSAKIRPSTAADLRVITGIYGHHVRTGTSSFEFEAPSLDEMIGRRQAILDKRLPYLVAESANGELLGYACVSPYRLRAAYRFTVENSIYIHPAFLGQGYGKLLLGSLIHECEQLGLREIIAVIGDSTNLASIRLHEQAGFLPIGVFRNVGLKFGKWLDTVLMQRSLQTRALNFQPAESPES